MDYINENTCVIWLLWWIELKRQEEKGTKKKKQTSKQNGDRKKYRPFFFLLCFWVLLTFERSPPALATMIVEIKKNMKSCDNNDDNSREAENETLGEVYSSFFYC